jgi:hypothetical protein
MASINDVTSDGKQDLNIKNQDTPVLIDIPVLVPLSVDIFDERIESIH